MVIYRLGLPYYKEFDNFQFAKMTTDRKFDIFVTKASISLS